MYSYTVYDGQHLKRVGCVQQWLSKGVPRNFGCYIIADKKKLYIIPFKINFTCTYVVSSKYNIHLHNYHRILNKTVPDCPVVLSS